MADGPFSLDRLSVFPIVGSGGKPTQSFQRLWQKMCQSIETQINDILTAQATATAAAREAARINSYTIPSDVLTAEDLGGSAGAKIIVASHSRIYPVQGSIDVEDVAITGATLAGPYAYATQYSVYYVDTSLEDGTPSFLVVVTATNHADAQPGAAAGVHFLGVVTTPTDGGSPTTGTGGAPPGGGADTPIQ